jgi:(p)ppGpp synthase/HD superfamily hydrolase
MALAAQVHRGKKDKQGCPYLGHPLRVAARAMESSEGNLEAVTVALLHDVVEDSHVTTDDLRRRDFSEAVCAAVELVTHRPEDSYEKFIARIAGSGDELAKLVKLCDLEDNLDEGRGPVPPELREKYEPARLTLSRTSDLAHAAPIGAGKTTADALLPSVRIRRDTGG